MVLIVTQKYVIKQGTVGGQVPDRNFQRLRVPEFRLLLLLLDVELLEECQFFSQLDQESELCRHAEVADHEVGNGLKKAHTVDFLLVPVPGKEILSFDHADLHNVADVEVLNPF